MNKTHFDVLVVGTPCVDIVFGGMPHWPVLGQEMYVNHFGVSAGAVFNTAATLSRLGLRVALLTELGNDFFSRYILEEIDKAGISRDLVLIRDQALFSVSVCLAHESERGFISYSNLGSEMVPRLLDGYQFDAVFTYARPAMLPYINFFTRRGTKLFFDTGWNRHELSDPRMIEVLKHGNIIMPNQLEATFLMGTETAEAAACALAALIPQGMIIVKMGSQGVVACQNGSLTYCAAYPIDEVVDTTGAGDAFNGALAVALGENRRLADAAAWATAAAALAVTQRGAQSALPFRDAIDGLAAQAKRD